jgi:hypothetical protein
MYLRLLPVAAFLLAAPVLAHEVHQTSATVQLRDAHVEVRIQANVHDWLAQAAPSGGLDDRIRVASAGLVSDTVLRVDGERVPFVSLTLPPTEVLLADARDPHAPHREIRLEARLDGPAGRVSLTLPLPMGDAIVTFVHPTTRYTLAGKTAAFTVPTRPTRIDRKP